MTVEQELAELKQVIATAQKERAKQEARAEQLKARRDELVMKLKTEFGCSSIAEAKEKLNAADTEHAAKLEEIRQALKEAAL